MDTKPSDAPNPTYCQTLSTGTYTFCADFDESSVSLGYQNGTPLAWSTVSMPPPGRSTMVELSSPFAAQFQGVSNSLLGFVSPSMLDNISLDGWIHVDATASTTNTVVVFLMSPTYAVTIALMSAGAAFQMTVSEIVVTSDAGVLSIPHAAPAFLATGVWLELVGSVSGATVTVSLGNANSVTFTPASASRKQPSTSIGFSGKGWTGEWDNVVIHPT
jgi:hypothetical protein